MTWLIVLVSLTYCFTVGLTARYKELIVELREKNMRDEKDFQIEISELLIENGELVARLKQYEEGRYYGKS